MHKLLSRQLRKHLGTETPGDPALAGLVAAVDAAYRDQDSDRALLERSIELASTELREKNLQLQCDLESIKRLEVELRQADKLRAVGQLASGIAHEINTPIQFAGDSLHFLRDALADLIRLACQSRVIAEARNDTDDCRPALEQYLSACVDADVDYLVEEAPKALAQAAEGLKRVAEIVTAMKDFGRTDQREKSLVDINRCLQSTITIASNEVRHTARIDLSLGELPLVPGFHGELGQVFLNLLVNAAHAIADRFKGQGLGRISVVTSSDDDGVTIAISDNGAGIGATDRSRIFEPFFTTKEVGRGTGQGLAISRSIIADKHGGSLSFDSEVGVGTTFFIKLPSTARCALSSVELLA